VLVLVLLVLVLVLVLLVLLVLVPLVLVQQQKPTRKWKQPTPGDEQRSVDRTSREIHWWWWRRRPRRARIRAQGRSSSSSSSHETPPEPIQGVQQICRGRQGKMDPASQLLDQRPAAPTTTGSDDEESDELRWQCSRYPSIRRRLKVLAVPDAGCSNGHTSRRRTTTDRYRTKGLAMQCDCPSRVRLLLS
jgi:hypothetical protein